MIPKLISIFLRKKYLQKALPWVLRFGSLVVAFFKFLFSFLKGKIMIASLFFEKHKNILVRFFMMKRGRYNRPFLHISAMGVLAIGVIVAPILADQYPIFSPGISPAVSLAQASEQSITVDQNVFKTDISQKPRDKVVNYTVQNGDTLSTIARKFDVSEDTIRWANDMTNDNINVGDDLKIPPVTGIVHKVAKGETVYSIAKLYGTDPQQIVDFPFNEFVNPQTFTLVEGQILIVPNGVKPSEKPSVRQQYIVQGPVGQVSSAGFTWPVRGIITQFASWYHMALDIAAPYGTPIVAAQNGTVSLVNTGTYDGGYGNNVYVDDGNGFKSHYAHMSAVNVSAGQVVTAGKTIIGWIGLTGRTTGPHVHFEILHNGVLVNPLSYLQ